MTRFTAALLGALVLTTPAMAADVYGSSKDASGGYEPARNPFAGFYIGADAGGEFANIDILDTFDGIGADGLTGGVHAGYNLCVNRVCFGPYIEGGLSNVNTDIGGFDLITQDYYVQGGAMIGYMVGNATLISVHAGYDYSAWSSDVLPLLGVSDDITVGAIAIGSGIDTMIARNLSLGVKVDYLMVNGVDLDNTDITDAIEESEAFRAKVRLTYRH
jgi:opacity protein-like surface antigen